MLQNELNVLPKLPKTTTFSCFHSVPPTGWNLLIWSRRNARLLVTWRGRTGTKTAASCCSSACTLSWMCSSSSSQCGRTHMEVSGSWWPRAAASVSTSTALLLWWVELITHLILNISCSDRRFCLTGANVEAVFDVASCHLGGEGLTFGPEHSTASDRGLRHLDLHHCAHWRSRHQLW